MQMDAKAGGRRAGRGRREAAPVIDLHSDIMSDVAWRRARGERRVIVRRHLPGLQAAGVTAVGLTLWVEVDQMHRAPARLRELLSYLQMELAESPAELQMVRTPAEAAGARSAGRLALLLTVEGLAAVGEDPSLWDELRARGLTSALLTWNEANAFASGFPGYPYAEAVALSAAGQGDWLAGLRGPGPGGGAGGLTDRGRALLAEMAAAVVMLDLSHLNDTSFWAALEAYPGRGVLASHSNARAVCDIPRNLTDGQIRAIAARDGVIGLNAFSGFVDPARPGVERYIDHAVYIAGLVGVRHLGFGFDFIRYLEPEALAMVGGVPPGNPGLDEVADVPGLLERMARRGFSPAELAAIGWGNFERVWRAGQDKAGGEPK